jgi:hypothetical protein
MNRCSTKAQSSDGVAGGCRRLAAGGSVLS